jgi:hypothetical protein
MRVRAFDKKKKTWIEPEEIARLHFNEGECYGLMTWDEKLLLNDDFTIEIVQPPQRETVQSSSRQVEALVSPQCDHIVGVMPNDKPYYAKGDIRWTCSSDIKNATSEEKELYEKKLAKFKYCPICGEALSP